MDLQEREEYEKYKEELKEQRLNEQERGSDYAYLENGELERCDNCGGFINSHDHCPNCDY